MSHHDISFTYILRIVITFFLVAMGSGQVAFSQTSTTGGRDMNGITEELFGTTGEGNEVKRYTLVNSSGSILKVIELGATATELHVRDREGNLSDVVLGFETSVEYEENSPYLGCTTGRVANRISNGRFELDGVEYQLARNFGKHHLHGGVVGLHKRVWKSEPVEHDSGPAVKFRYLSPEDEEGYPGELSITVLYILTEKDSLRIEYEATTSQATPVNLTNHTYFNLSGAGSGPIYDHVLTLNGDRFTEPDADGVPTGAILPVEETPLDFNEPKRIGEDFKELPIGYDHNYVLNHGGGDQPQLSAEVYDPKSGRVMRMFTTEPGVQFYTSGFLEKTVGKGGAVYDQFHALCLEAQHFPDSVNKPQFPSVILRPGEIYRQVTEYRFSVR